MTHEMWNDIAPGARVIGWFSLLLGCVKSILVATGFSIFPSVGGAASLVMITIGAAILGIASQKPPPLQIKCCGGSPVWLFLSLQPSRLGYGC